MSQATRSRIPGCTAFFTVRPVPAGVADLTDHIDDLRLAVARTRAELPFVIDAFVVLPDHLHAIWTLPPGDTDHARRWTAIRTRLARLLRLRGRARLWPDPDAPTGADAGDQRWWRDDAIGDDATYAAHLHRCWWNPVRHGLVDHPERWPWSSVHRERRNGFLNDRHATAPWPLGPGPGQGPGPDMPAARNARIPGW